MEFCTTTGVGTRTEGTIAIGEPGNTDYREIANGKTIWEGGGW